ALAEPPARHLSHGGEDPVPAPMRPGLRRLLAPGLTGLVPSPEMVPVLFFEGVGDVVGVVGSVTAGAAVIVFVVAWAAGPAVAVVPTPGGLAQRGGQGVTDGFAGVLADELGDVLAEPGP